MTTLRRSLELLVRNHGYDGDSWTCRCGTQQLTPSDHSAHVVQLILNTLNGSQVTV